MTILLSVWSSLKGSKKGGGCNVANDHSGGNGCALLGLRVSLAIPSNFYNFLTQFFFHYFTYHNITIDLMTSFTFFHRFLLFYLPPQSLCLSSSMLPRSSHLSCGSSHIYCPFPFNVSMVQVPNLTIVLFLLSVIYPPCKQCLLIPITVLQKGAGPCMSA